MYYIQKKKINFYIFIINYINWNDINLNNHNKKLTYNNMSFFKSASNYKEFSYFTCENNKKNQKKKEIKGYVMLILR